MKGTLSPAEMSYFLDCGNELVLTWLHYLEIRKTEICISDECKEI